VRVNAVAPSLTSSEATADLEKNEAIMKAFEDRLPIGRAATPDDIAGVTAFLGSDDAVFINGVIRVGTVGRVHIGVDGTHPDGINGYDFWTEIASRARCVAFDSRF